MRLSVRMGSGHLYPFIYPLALWGSTCALSICSPDLQLRRPDPHFDNPIKPLYRDCVHVSPSPHRFSRNLTREFLDARKASMREAPRPPPGFIPPMLRFRPVIYPWIDHDNLVRICNLPESECRSGDNWCLRIAKIRHAEIRQWPFLFCAILLFDNAFSYVW